MEREISERTGAMTITLSEAEADQWCDGGAIGDEYRASLRSEIGAICHVEIIDQDGIVLDAWDAESAEGIDEDDDVRHILTDDGRRKLMDQLGEAARDPESLVEAVWVEMAEDAADEAFAADCAATLEMRSTLTRTGRPVVVDLPLDWFCEETR